MEVLVPVGERASNSTHDDVGLRLDRPLNAKEIGRFGEDIAADYFRRHGYEILERNWTCWAGEADIIVTERAGEAVLVEVKTRRLRPGLPEVLPELAIGKAKLAKYRLIALAYLALNPQIDGVRFDVVAVTIKSSNLGHVHHVSNAYRWVD
jgi:putative endonuclease